MNNYFTKFLAAYDYGDFREFSLSVFPTFKYELQGLMMLVSFVSGTVNYFFGIQPALAAAMFVAVVVEVWTGIKASRKLGKKFESFRFSRCVIKIGIWLIILYIIHAFEKEYESRTNLIQMAAYAFFNFVYVVALTGFLVEYVTSILENVAVLQNKPKTQIIEAIQSGWSRFTDSIKSKKNEN
ncbi:MAG: phage holin family protein [Paludibacter sp.]